jgi:Undecaprenyl-phosphate galactose phosphotransferase WbaP
MRIRSLPTSLGLMSGDIASVTLCSVISWWVKALADPQLSAAPYLGVLPALIFGIVASFTFLGLYPAIGRGPAEELRNLSYGTSLVFLVGIALTFLAQTGAEWSRQVFFLAWAMCLVVVPLVRALVRSSCSRARWWGVPVVVIGAGATGARVIDLLEARPWLGLRPVAVLDDDPSKLDSRIGSLQVAGPLEQRATDLAKEGIRHAIIAMPGLPPDRLAAMLDRLADSYRHIYIAPALPGSPDLIAESREFANNLVLEVRAELLRPEARIIKRTLDLFTSLVGGLLVSPLIGIIVLSIRLTSRGPAFYSQERIGCGGRTFRAWKFRSMVHDADWQLQVYLEQHPELREEWERDHKLKNDPRVTFVGRLLRRTSLDELPQLWNILCGEMSLVGPRPIVRAEVERYGERFPLFCKVRPGLSGLWQVSGRSDTSYVERVALDAYYVRNWSVWLDLVILARTMRVVVLGKGAY